MLLVFGRVVGIVRTVEVARHVPIVVAVARVREVVRLPEVECLGVLTAVVGVLADRLHAKLATALNHACVHEQIISALCTS